MSPSQIATYAFAVLAVAIGAVDLWHFGKLGTSADLLFIVGGLAGGGVKLAFDTGVNVPTPPTK